MTKKDKKFKLKFPSKITNHERLIANLPEDDIKQVSELIGYDFESDRN